MPNVNTIKEESKNLAELIHFVDIDPCSEQFVRNVAMNVVIWTRSILCRFLLFMMSADGLSLLMLICWFMLTLLEMLISLIPLIVGILLFIRIANLKLQVLAHICRGLFWINDSLFFKIFIIFKIFYIFYIFYIFFIFWIF